MRKRLLSNRLAVCLNCSFVAWSFTCAICKIDSFNLSPFFNLIQHPATLPKMWNGPATTSGISGFLLCVFDILACLFGRPFFFDSRHYFWFWFWTQFWVSFLPLFLGGATKEINWRPLKTGAKIVSQIGLKIQPKKFDPKAKKRVAETNQCRHQRRRDRSCLLSLDHCKSLAKSPGVGSSFKNDN